MPEFVNTFFLGAVIAIMFVIFGLPVPVTPTFAGFMGIAGLFVGFVVASKALA